MRGLGRLIALPWLLVALAVQGLAPAQAQAMPRDVFGLPICSIEHHSDRHQDPDGRFRKELPEFLFQRRSRRLRCRHGMISAGDRLGFRETLDQSHGSFLSSATVAFIGRPRP